MIILFSKKDIKKEDFIAQDSIDSVMQFFEKVLLKPINILEIDISPDEKQKSKLVKFYFTLVLHYSSLHFMNTKYLINKFAIDLFQTLIIDSSNFPLFSFKAIHKILSKMFKGSKHFKNMKVNELTHEYVRIIKTLPNLNSYFELIEKIKLDRFSYYTSIMAILLKTQSEMIINISIKYDDDYFYRKMVVNLLQDSEELIYFASCENFKKMFSFTKNVYVDYNNFEFKDIIRGIMNYENNHENVEDFFEPIFLKLLKNLTNVTNVTYIDTLYLAILEKFSPIIITNFKNLDFTGMDIKSFSRILPYIILTVNQFSKSKEPKLIGDYWNNLYNYFSHMLKLLEVDLNTGDKLLIRKYYSVFGVLIDCFISLFRRYDFERKMIYCVKCLYKLNDKYPETKIVYICPKCNEEHLYMTSIYDEKCDTIAELFKSIFLEIFIIIEEGILRLNRRRGMKFIYHLLKRFDFFDFKFIDHIKSFFSNLDNFVACERYLKKIIKLKILINYDE
jgi:hypothetical protein